MPIDNSPLHSRPATPLATTPQPAPRGMQVRSDAGRLDLDPQTREAFVDAPAAQMQPPTPGALAIQAPSSHPSGSALGPAQNDRSRRAASATTAATPMANAIAAAKARGLGALQLEVSKSTQQARSIVSKMTLAGLGVSMGLLFAGQPFAVVLVVPALAAVGVGLSWWMRRRLNDGQKPAIEAFKELMRNASDETKASPEYARSQKLYSFLTDSYAHQARAHLADVFGKLHRLTSAKAPGPQALTRANLAALDALTPNDSASAYSSYDSQAGSNNNSVPAATQALVAPFIPARPPVAQLPPVERSSFESGDAFIAAWHAQNPGVDPTHAFDEGDISEYQGIKKAILEGAASSLMPTWAASPKVLRAFSIHESDRFVAVDASTLRRQLGL